MFDVCSHALDRVFEFTHETIDCVDVIVQCRCHHKRPEFIIVICVQVFAALLLCFDTCAMLLIAL